MFELPNKLLYLAGADSSPLPSAPAGENRSRPTQPFCTFPGDVSACVP